MSTKEEKLIRIKLNDDWCKTCYICVDLCPKGVLAKADKVSKKAKNGRDRRKSRAPH